MLLLEARALNSLEKLKKELPHGSSRQVISSLLSMLLDKALVDQPVQGYAQWECRWTLTARSTGLTM